MNLIQSKSDYHMFSFLIVYVSSRAYFQGVLSLKIATNNSSFALKFDIFPSCVLLELQSVV